MRQLIVGVVVGIIVGAAVLAAAQDAKAPVVVASEFRLVDADGKTRAVLGMEGGVARLSFLDASGAPAAEQTSHATKPEDAAPPQAEVDRAAPSPTSGASMEYLRIRNEYRVQSCEVVLTGPATIEEAMRTGVERISISAWLSGKGKVVGDYLKLPMILSRVGPSTKWSSEATIALLVSGDRAEQRADVTTSVLSARGISEMASLHAERTWVEAAIAGTSWEIDADGTELRTPPEWGRALQELVNCIGCDATGRSLELPKDDATLEPIRAALQRAAEQIDRREALANLPAAELELFRTWSGWSVEEMTTTDRCVSMLETTGKLAKDMPEYATQRDLMTTAFREIAGLLRACDTRAAASRMRRFHLEFVRTITGRVRKR